MDTTEGQKKVFEDGERKGKELERHLSVKGDQIRRRERVGGGFNYLGEI